MDMTDTPAIPGPKPRPRATTGHVAGGSATTRILRGAERTDPAFLIAWQKLVEGAAEPNPFFEPWFLTASFNHLDPNNTHTLLTHWSQEQLTGLMPLAQPTRYYGYPMPHLATWLHTNAFCGVPLVRSGYEQQFWRDALHHLDRNSRRALFLHCAQLPADGPVNRALDTVLAQTKRRAVTVDTAQRAMLSSQLSPEEYLKQNLSSKRRKELRRQRKRLEEAGALSFERCDDGSGIDQWIAEFLALEASGWKGDARSALGCDARTQAFFTHALNRAARFGRLERLTLRLDGAPIAMLANFLAPPGLFGFKTAFDERYARFSPGLLLQLENLDLLTRPGIDWADSCAVQGHSMIERIWSEKRRVISRNIALGGPIARAGFRLLSAYETRAGSGS